MGAREDKAKLDAGSDLPQRFIQGQRTFISDTFKGSVEKMKKNVGIDPKEPRLTEIEHTHIYHSFDSRGREMKKTTAVGGHWHEVTVDWTQKGPDGGPVVKCGPPLRFGMKDLGNGQRARSVMPLEWKRIIRRGDNVDAIKDVDNHTHSFKFLGSSVLKERPTDKVSEAEIAAALGMSQPSLSSTGVKIQER